MSVYVDCSRNRFGTMIMCHMLADTPEELHAMADQIGVKRKWFQGEASTPHYDVCLSKRRLAVEHGAVEVERRELVALLPQIRKAFAALPHGRRTPDPGDTVSYALTVPVKVPVDAMTPLLKWAGGKSKLAWEIMAAFSAAADGPPRVYAEPFFGGGAVLCALRQASRFAPSGLVLNDANAKLIAFYDEVRRDPDGVVAQIADLGLDVTAEKYAEVRRRVNEEVASTRAAAYFWWLNKACFNGLWRENREGRNNVPVGDRNVLASPDLVAFRAWAAGTKNARFLARDALGLLDTLIERGKTVPLDGWWIYLDPPYQGGFTAYTAAGFSLEQQLYLLDQCRALADVGAVVVYSNAAVGEITHVLRERDEVYREIGAGHRIAVGRSNVGHTEVLATFTRRP